MATSDAIVVGSDWISEHYFGTDATSQSFHARVLERRKEWDAAAKEATAERPADTVLTRFAAARRELLDAMSLLGSADDAGDLLPDPSGRGEEIASLLRGVLGFGGVGLALDTTGPLTRVRTPGLADGAPLVLVAARPVTSADVLLAKDVETLAEPLELDDGRTLTSVARLLSTLFVAVDGPDFALVLAGRFALVAERERWAEGRFLTLDLQLVAERNDTRRAGEVDRTLTCVSAASLAPGADGEIWWKGVLEESVRHTVGVSKDLREGVRHSIEIIAGEVVARRAAQGLDPLPKATAQDLAVQALRFLYRILFLLYAEAKPELGVLPTGAREYEQGYSLDRLRELVLVDLTDPTSQHGTHLYESLGVLFRLVDSGHDPAAGSADAATDLAEGLTFRSLKADLFLGRATSHIDEVGLGNEALQRVLQHLLLSKAAKGRDRGFISYAELGINQLGAVYEGLMSYTGFFAEEDLHEVAKGGDASKGSWVVPVTRSEGIDRADFVTEVDEHTHEERPVVHRRGSFVFRLAGRERQQSASYYTPEVLTRFVVSQALAELLDQDGTTTPAADVLQLTVCEPALGSGAFAIEAVRQLAEQYLTRRQAELGERIDPDRYPAELQKVKASIALHQVHGVDLNATAVELAEISLWLDTMVAGLEAPWFGLHLRRGNSLVGARRSVFRETQVAKGTWMKDTPVDVPMTGLVADVEADQVGASLDHGVHHFLLPALGWGSAAEAKEAKTLAAPALARLKEWRRGVRRKLTTTQARALGDVAQRVEALWQIAWHRLRIAENEIRRDIPLWGADPAASGGAVQRDEIERTLADPGGAYQRLRRVMDAWCALWFWPLTEEGVAPPTIEQWIEALQQLLGKPAGKKGRQQRDSFVSGTSWEELAERESLDLGFAGAVDVEAVLDAHPWLRVCERVATRQGFFHWELDFAVVFGRGGFDLQVGNPPWVRPESDVAGLLAEGDPRWLLSSGLQEAELDERREETLALPGILQTVIDGEADAQSLHEFISDEQLFPQLSGLRPDLYRCFLERSWGLGSGVGVQALVHAESHFTDQKAGKFRRAVYRRLRRHWHFVNELKLFDRNNDLQFGVTIHGVARTDVRFVQACWLYHPATIERSMRHDGAGLEPGLKDEYGSWDQRPHLGRIFCVDRETLASWRDVLGVEDAPVEETQAMFLLNASVAGVLRKAARAERVSSLQFEYSSGWNEKTDKTRRNIRKAWAAHDHWENVILQGPHIFVSTPMFKVPNPTLGSNRDWSDVDLEDLGEHAVPATSYQVEGSRSRYDSNYPAWGHNDSRYSPRDCYRIAWRNMGRPGKQRTLMPTIIPPGPAHIHTITSAGGKLVDDQMMVQVAGFLSSLIADLCVRVAPKSTISGFTVGRLPWVDTPLRGELVQRVLRLNAMTEAYAALWGSLAAKQNEVDSWSLEEAVSKSLSATNGKWSKSAPLRRALNRRAAQVEIDAIVAVSLGITADELCSVYRTQFPVLYGYDRNDHHYDANGRLVPTPVLQVWRAKGDKLTETERTATNQAGNTYVYELPFRTLDREADMRTAHAHFSKLLEERS